MIHTTGAVTFQSRASQIFFTMSEQGSCALNMITCVDTPFQTQQRTCIHFLTEIWTVPVHVRVDSFTMTDIYLYSKNPEMVTTFL